MNNATKKPPATMASDPPEVEHQIRQRAYELYEESGRQDGHELDNWLRAKVIPGAKRVLSRPYFWS